MLLEVKNLSKEYKRGSKPFFAVRHVNLKLDDGDFAIIIGRSGSGKSTLLNLIGGLLTPTSGEIRISGRNLALVNDKEGSLFRNSTIGFVPQGQSILSSLTVLDNVRLPHYLWNRQGDVTERALSLLDQVGIKHLANAYPQHLSGGELRRVAIARALMNNPRLLLADEPTNDLDSQTAGEILGLLSNIARTGTTVLMVTHDTQAIKFGNRIYEMIDGDLLESIPENTWSKVASS
jgi:putative ABC transport system ATP-binding protein